MEQGYEGTTTSITCGGTSIGPASALASDMRFAYLADPEHNLIELLRPIR